MQKLLSEGNSHIKLFIDPKALRLLPSVWGVGCVSLVQNFFKTVIKNIKSGNDRSAKLLLSSLKEPNETHLGLSRGKAQGRALGDGSAIVVWESLKESEAARTGLLQDLEDTILMVEGIGPDIVSDIIANIIRGQLISYTAKCSIEYDIPLKQGVSSGPIWDIKNHEWTQKFTSLPMTPSGKLLLVPKVIVRSKMGYDLNEYYNHYILEELRQQELSSNSELVHLLKSGKSIVTKKSLREKYGQSKSLVIRETLKHPVLLDRYRDDKRKEVSPPLNHQQLAHIEDAPCPDWETLLNELFSIPVGRYDATNYENSIEKLLTATLYPSLTNPETQKRIHNGRKRIDISYVNVATDGFFQWLSSNYSAMHVFIECKNYGKDIGNPELDQLAGRFSPSRGQFGILCCRSFQDKNLFIKRCKDTASDRRGYIIPLDDDDLRRLVEIVQSNDDKAHFAFFKQKFDHLIM